MNIGIIILAVIAIWIGYKIWRAWPQIVATARAQADAMDDMSVGQALKYSLFGSVDDKCEKLD